MKSVIVTKLFLATATLAVGLLLPADQSTAATFVVNTTLDRPDRNPGDGQCKSFDGKCSLRAAIMEANARPGADIIRLSAGTYELQIPPFEPPSSDIVVVGDDNGDFDITGPLTITGAGPGVTIIDGGTPPPEETFEVKGLDRLFEIHRDAGDVTMTGLTLREGYTPEAGGGILFGAGPDETPAGLPIAASTGTLRLENVHVVDCYSAKYGGGVQNAGRGRVEIINSVFTKNGANEGGSAINNANAGTVAILAGSAITNNPGTFIPDPLNPGGFIYDPVVYHMIPDPIEPGAFIYDPDFMIEDPDNPGTFIPEVYVYQVGPGAIHNQGDLQSVGTIIIADSTISGNVAYMDGVAVHNGGDGFVFIERSTISRNYTEGSAGAVYNYAGSVTITDSVISDHIAKDGGGLFNCGELTLSSLRGRMEVIRSVISNNVSHANGGGFFNEQDGEMILTDVIVTDNFAHDFGAGGYSDGRSGLIINGGRFTGNKAIGSGGGLSFEGERPLVINGTIFTNNIAGTLTDELDEFGNIALDEFGRPLTGDGAGGGLYADGSGSLEIFGAIFDNNTSVDDGGGISLHGAGPTLIEDTKVRNNRVAGGTPEEPEGSGGGIENSGLRVTFRRLIVSGNTAAHEGGGIHNTSSGLFTMEDCVIERNVAGNGGGYVNASDSTLEVRRTLFYKNVALPGIDRGHGGGIYSMSDGDSLYENCTVSHNVAHFSGGGLYHDADGDLQIVNTTMWRNSAPSGGAISVLESDSPPPKIPPDTNLVSVTVRNSIIGGSLQGGSCDAAMKTGGGNVDSDRMCYFIGPGDISGVDPELDAIADNGGFTMTHALRANSVAIDRIPGVTLQPTPLTDARGVSRPQNGRHDSGAYEYEGPWAPPDTTPPNTAFVSQQNDDNGQGEVVWTFRFDSDDDRTPPSQMSFQCKLIEFDPTEAPEPIIPGEIIPPELDWQTCGNPWRIIPIGEGLMTLEVRAIDHFGNMDPTPAVHHFFIDESAMTDTVITLGPANNSPNRVATFVFTGVDAGTPPSLFEYECRLDSNDPEHWMECFNPVSYGDLTTGQHTFEVRAAGVVGEMADMSPARWTWNVGAPSNCDEANIVLPPVADTWIDEVNPLENMMFMQELTVAADELPGNAARTLVRFPVPTDAPSCALERATLRLYNGSHTEGRTLVALRILAPWSENTVTWANKPPAAAVTVLTPRAESGEGYIEWDVTAHVNLFRSNAVPNYGWMIKDLREVDPNGGGDQSFASKELLWDPPEITTPQLVLRYEAASLPAPQAQPAPVPDFVWCGKMITNSTLVMNDLIDCPNEGLLIGAPDIILDLNGHTIDGPGYLTNNISGQEEGFGAGIRNSGHNNVIIRNGTVQDLGYGVLLGVGTTRNVIENLTIIRNAMAGVELQDSDNGRVGNIIRNNIIKDNELGISLIQGSEYSLIISNRLLGNLGEQIYMFSASGHRIEGNFMNGVPSDPLFDSDGGVMLEGASRNNVIINNWITDSSDASVMITQQSHDNRVEGNTLPRPGDAGVYIQDSFRNQVISNIAHQASDGGVTLNNASHTVVRGNDVRFNAAGVDVSGSSFVIVEGNDASYSLQEGILIGSGTTNFVVRNNIANLTGGTGIAVETGEFDANGNPVGPGVIEGNTANENLAEGISIAAGGHLVRNNNAHNNAGTGISAGEINVDTGVPENIDGGGNRASGNHAPEQCTGVFCFTSGTVALLPQATAQPETVITAKPPLVTSSTSAIFEFTGIDSFYPSTALVFECRFDPLPDPPFFPEIDPDPPEPPVPGQPPAPPDFDTPPEGPGWAECISPLNVALLYGGEIIMPLLPGTHRFEVRAVSLTEAVSPLTGEPLNKDATPAVYTWTIDPTAEDEDLTPESIPPSTTIFAGPSGETSSSTATFGFRGSDNRTPGPLLTYQCSLDGSAFVACTSPITYQDISGGQHTFAVAAIDRWGNVDPSPATRTWTSAGADPQSGDATPPDTTIASGPHPATVLTSATFTFSSSEPGSTFECSVNNGATYAACASPAIFTGLPVGDRTFLVRATDAAGNTDPTPAAYPWYIGPAPVPTVVGCGDVITESIIVQNDLMDCLAHGLIIGAERITVDLGGNTIDGSGGAVGILNEGFDMVTIQNGTLQEFDLGILLTAGTEHNLISGMHVKDVSMGGVVTLNADDTTIRNGEFVGSDSGVYLAHGTERALVHNNIVGSSGNDGIRIELSSDNRIEANHVAGSSGAGVVMAGSSRNTVVGNLFEANDAAGVLIEPMLPSDSIYEDITNLLVIIVELVGEPLDPLTGEPIEYPDPLPPPGLDLLETNFGEPSNDNLVENNNIEGGGIEVQESSGNRLINNTIRDASGAAIYVELSVNTLIKGNDLRLNSAGIDLKTASGNRIEANSANEGSYGIRLDADSLNNVIVANTANYNNGDGIYIGDRAMLGNGNLIQNNTANNNGGMGIHVAGYGHTIIGNVANDNGYLGIYSLLGVGITESNIDGGGNRAAGSLGGILDPFTFAPVQCFNIVCDGSAPLADPIPPETMIISGPANPTLERTATFRFTGSDNLAVVRFQCRLDSINVADFAPCTSPATYSGLAVGDHKLEVRSVDGSGNVDPTPSSHVWTVAALPPGLAPNTTIVSGPDLTTISTTASFAFSANEAGATFECSSDGAAFAPCISPQAQSGLLVGRHTFQVRAVDAEGLVDASPARYSWTISSPPVAAVVSCGEILMESVRVMNDLFDCPGYALVAGADGITIDLNGHMLDGIGMDAGILNPHFHSVTIKNGTIREFVDGVQLNPGASQNIVESLILLMNKESGMTLSDANNAIIRGNSFRANAFDIWLTGLTRGALIRDNQFTDSTRDSIYLEYASHNRIENNRFIHSGGSGIFMFLGDGNTIAGNTFVDIMKDAIWILGGGEEEPMTGFHRIEGNSITATAAGLGGGGIVIAGGTGNQVLDNNVQGLVKAAIIIEEATDGLVRGNDVRGNGSGISLSATNYIVSYNDASSSLASGIAVGGINNTIMFNIANMTGGDGISVEDFAPPGMGNLIDRNIASANKGDGIAVQAPGHTVTGNTADFNGGYGIYAELGSIDGGGNKATGNIELFQCYTVVCEIGEAPGGPDTWFVETPPAVSASRFATFIFTGKSGIEPVLNLGFECRLDSTDPFAWETQECENPAYLGGLSEGPHIFEVRTVNPQGVVDMSPAVYIWTVDTRIAAGPPDTFIDFGPPAQSWIPEAIFTYHASEPDVAFQCQLDNLAWEPCSFDYEVPLNFAGWEVALLEHEVGRHTFRVRAVDFQGNVDPTPAEYSWNVMGVLAIITSGPGYMPPEVPGEPAMGGETESSTAIITFEATVPDATFLCSLDLAQFEPCTSPLVYTGLPMGEHILRILAFDSEGNSSAEGEPIEYEWEVVEPVFDTVPPDTTITLAPTPNSGEMIFEFTGTDNFTFPLLLTFECRLDSANALDWASCISPFNIHDLVPPEEFFAGTHTFEVRALDEAELIDPNAPQEGNADPTPATYTWTSALDTIAPVVTITSGPDAQVGPETPVFFTWVGTDNATPPPNPDPETLLPLSPFVITFECAVDTDVGTGLPVWEPCDGFAYEPYEATGLEPGLHTFQVRGIDVALNVGAPAVYTWTVVGPPVVLINSGPPTGSPSASRTATFTFSADQPVIVFICSHEGIEQPCTSPFTITHLLDGSQSFEVHAINSFRTVGDPTSYSWTVAGPPDTEAPDTLITGAQTAPVDPENPAVTQFMIFFTATEPHVTFQCSLDGAPFGGCESPYPVTQDLLQGTHTLAVRATDFAGNMDPTPAIHSFQQNTRPVVTILSGPDVTAIDPGDPVEPVDPLDPEPVDPSGVSTSASATFVFEANEPNVTFQCWLDGVITPCTSPVTYDGLGMGEHIFAVLATDSTGLTGVEWAIWEWEVDQTPDTIIISGPADHSNQTLVKFRGTDNLTLELTNAAMAAAALSFECRIDSTDEQNWAGCESPYSVLDLIQPEFLNGPHTIEIRAVDGNDLIDPTPATYSWTYAPDITPPQTTIDSGPAPRTADPLAMFTFSSSEPGSTFECLISNPEFEPGTPNEPPVWESCTSPFQLELDPLMMGGHIFRVRAIDPSLNVDPSPAGYTWRLLAPPPETEIESGPPLLPYDTFGTFIFSGVDELTGLPTVAFECSLDGEAFTDCSPGPDLLALGIGVADVSGLSVGSHTFAVRATGFGGTTDPTPAVWAWIIEAMPPPNCGPAVSALTDADAWLEQSSPTVNKGLDSELKIQSKGPGQNMRAVVNFPMPIQPLGCKVQSATLRMFSPGGKPDRTLQAIRLAEAWDESLITWGNQPATTGPAASTTSGVGYLDWNVKAQVQAMYNSGQHFGFLIRDADEDNPTNSFDQKLYALEKGPGMAELLVTFSPASAGDTRAPVTLLDSKPEAVTADTSATFTFGANEAGSTFQCALGVTGGGFTNVADGVMIGSGGVVWEPFADCSGGSVSYSGLALGTHLFRVRAIDAAGNPDSTPASYRWTVVELATVLDTRILIGPAPNTAATDATFDFTGVDNNTPEEQLTFECSLDGEPFIGCASPVIYPGPLALGQHTFQVAAIDLDGNVDSTPAFLEWTIDTSDHIPPQTIIVSGPPPVSGAEFYLFGFLGIDNTTPAIDMYFECQINDSAWFQCENPFEVAAPEPLELGQVPEPVIGPEPPPVHDPATSQMVDPPPVMVHDGVTSEIVEAQWAEPVAVYGTNTLRVRAFDVNPGTEQPVNADPTPAEFTWTAIPPPTTILLSGPGHIAIPPGGFTSVMHDPATSAFVEPGHDPLTSALILPVHDPATSEIIEPGTVHDPATSDLIDLVPALVHDGLTSQMVELEIGGGTFYGGISSNDFAVFTFTASEPNVGFLCTYERGNLAFINVPCTSPFVISNLLDGESYSFEVMATNLFTLAFEPQPAVYEWDVFLPLDNAPPNTQILTAPPHFTANQEVLFTFTGRDNRTPFGDLEFTCYLDGVLLGSCSSPYQVAVTEGLIQPAPIEPLPVHDGMFSEQVEPAHVPTTSQLVVPVPVHDALTSEVVQPLHNAATSEMIPPVHDTATSELVEPEPVLVHDPLTSDMVEPEPRIVYHEPFTSRTVDASPQLLHDPTTSTQIEVTPEVTHNPTTSEIILLTTQLVHEPGTSAMLEFMPELVHEPVTSQIAQVTPELVHDPATSDVFEFLPTLVHEPITSQVVQLTPELVHDPATSDMLEVMPQLEHNTTTSQLVQVTPSLFEVHDPATSEIELVVPLQFEPVEPVPFMPEGGYHRFEVRAMDVLGNLDPTPAFWTWTIVDVTPPDTSILSGPDPIELVVEPGQVPEPPEPIDPLANFWFFEGREIETGALVNRFECSLDGAPFAPCTSGMPVAVFADGPHIMMVRAIDRAGNPDPTPDIWEWLVETALDTTPPETYILGVSTPILEAPQPGSPPVTFVAFSASEVEVVFECVLDPAPGALAALAAALPAEGGWESCDVPHELVELTPGPHTIVVRAIDEMLNVDPTPASFTWITGVEVTEPNTFIISGPGNQNPELFATFTFGSDQPDATFLCSLDGGEPLGCISPHFVHVVIGPAEEEPHIFEVYAVSALGVIDETPATWEWTIGGPPETMLLSVTRLGPTDLTEPDSLMFMFTGSDDRTLLIDLEFECALDSEPFGACDGLNVHYLPLLELEGGVHTLYIRAMDLAGNVDPTPASYTWTTLPTPDTIIVSGPEDQTSLDAAIETASTSATFVFSATLEGAPYPAATFECSLDMQAYAPCGASVTFNNLALGDHELLVRAVHAADTTTVDLEPALFEWTVGEMTPVEIAFTSGPGVFTLPIEPGEPWTGGTNSLGDPVPTTETTATFTFTTSAPGYTILCSLDGGLPAPCISPVSFTAVQLAFSTSIEGAGGTPIGTHSLEIQAFQPFLLGHETNAVYEWTIADVEAPETTITSAPPALTGSPEATFEFTGSDNGTPAIALDFECSLDGAEFLGCSSPHLIPDLTDGSHTFAVRAIDGAEPLDPNAVDWLGNVDPTPATHSWTVNSSLVFCGQVLTNDMVLGMDLLDCPGDGLVIGAPGITVDLNGHTIDGVGATNGVWQFVGINNPGYEMVTIIDSTGNGMVTDFQTGILVGSGAISNVVFGVRAATNETGIAVLSAGTELDSNVILSNRVAGNQIGIMLGGGAENVVVFGNTVVGNLDQGIRLEDAGISWLEANTVSGSAGANIVLDQSSISNTVIRNTLSGSTAGYALVIMGASDLNWVEANNITASAVGIGVFESIGNKAVANIIRQSTYAGIVLGTDRESVVTGNDVRFNQEGIVLLGSSDTLVEANNASDTLGNGIWVASDAQGTPSIGNVLMLNTASRNADNGILVTASTTDSPASPTSPPDPPDPSVPDPTDPVPPEPIEPPLLANLIDRNVANNNGSDGIRVSGSGFLISANSADNNAGWGILVAQGNTDGGQNVATGNSLGQCFGITCNGDGGPDVTPPQTVITLAPPDVTVATTATFEFTANEQVFLFECSLDGLPYAQCLSPILYEGLMGGNHTFAVRSTDIATNQGAPTTHTWLINLPPETEILTGPEETTNSTSATFTFIAGSVDAPVTGATFECRHVLATTAVLESIPFAPCSSPHTISGLGSGEYEFEVRAISLGLADQTPDDYSWIIDASAPNTAIGEGPSGTTNSTSATFTFVATEDGTFLCSMDSGAWTPCMSPKTYTGLSRGTTHIFGVIAVDAAGNADQTPATRTWEISGPLPPLQAVIIGASADAWIDQNSKDANKGGDSVVKVTSKSPNNNARALFRFDIPATPAGYVLQSASLRIYSPSAQGARTLQAIRITGFWNENTVTWDNQPPTAGAAATTSSGIGYRQWNVTAQVQAGATGGFMIRDASENGTGFEQQLHSREKGESMPELVITFAPAP